MTTLNPNTWADLGPHYAPCITFSGPRAYWTPTRRYRKAGFKGPRVALGPVDQSQPVPVDVAMRCRALTREMVEWFDSLEANPGTWGWLIGRYKRDVYSPYQDVRANTREGYDQSLAAIDTVIGSKLISATTYEVLMETKIAMSEAGRSIDHIHRWFNTLRRVARYGVLIDAQGAERVATVLATMRVPKPAPRSAAPTREQVYAIIEQADARGLHVCACGWLIQWWFQLRAIDVRGVKLDGVWSDGLTWEMFNPDMSAFEKVISKTRKALPEPYRFDLALVPDVRERLITIYRTLPPRLQTGPVTVNPRSGRPYSETGWTGAWARCRSAAGVSEDIKLMDVRAGALTEAGAMPGVTSLMLRNAAQHTQQSTTDRYLRDRSGDVARILEIRTKGMKR